MSIPTAITAKSPRKISLGSSSKMNCLMFNSFLEMSQPSTDIMAHPQLPQDFTLGFQAGL